jgi:hypothetical protein
VGILRNDDETDCVIPVREPGNDARAKASNFDLLLASCRRMSSVILAKSDATAVAASAGTLNPLGVASGVDISTN